MGSLNTGGGIPVLFAVQIASFKKANLDKTDAKYDFIIMDFPFVFLNNMGTRKG
jgi:hypothetical protein